MLLFYFPASFGFLFALSLVLLGALEKKIERDLVSRSVTHGETPRFPRVRVFNLRPNGRTCLFIL